MASSFGTSDGIAADLVDARFSIQKTGERTGNALKRGYTFGIGSYTTKEPPILLAVRWF